MPVVAEDPISRKYFGEGITNFLYFLFFLLTLALPAIISLTTGSFWAKDNFYYGQPKINFNEKSVFRLDSQNASYMWSSVSSFRENSPAIKISAPQQQVTSQPNLGKLTFDFTFSLPQAESIYSAQALLFLSYEIPGTMPVSFEAVAFVHSFGSLPSDRTIVDGQLRLFQRVPLEAAYSNKGSVLTDSSVVTSSDAEISSVLALYSDLPVRADFSNQYPIWEPLVGGATASTSFTMRVVVRTPTETVKYFSAPGETLKWAWVQYVSFFFVFRWIFNAVLGFLVRGGILNSRLVVESVPKTHQF